MYMYNTITHRKKEEKNYSINAQVLIILTPYYAVFFIPIRLFPLKSNNFYNAWGNIPMRTHFLFIPSPIPRQIDRLLIHICTQRILCNSICDQLNFCRRDDKERGGTNRSLRNEIFNFYFFKYNFF